MAAVVQLNAPRFTRRSPSILPGLERRIAESEYAFLGDCRVL